MVVLKRDVDQQFSTFVKIADDCFEGWITDPRLKRNLDLQKVMLQCDPSADFPTRFWVSFFYQIWQHSLPEQRRFQELSLSHLYAYLQGPCYWSAYKLSRRFSTIQFGLGDCFQAACVKSDNVLRGFRPELGHTLSTYATQVFANAIRDALAACNEVQIASELSLLKRCTGKRLVEALEEAGLSLAMQSNYQAAWRSFQKFYFPLQIPARTLASLTEDDWSAISAQYEILRQKDLSLVAACEADLQDWLETCVLYLRRYTIPQAVSLNAGLGDSDEFVDRLSDTREQTLTLLLSQEAEQERRERQHQVAELLSNALSQLDPSIHLLLQLYYGDQMIQKDIAAQLGMQQYQVSRQLSRARQILLKVLVTWSREDLHIVCDPAVLNNMTVILDDWLKTQFSGERNRDADV